MLPSPEDIASYYTYGGRLSAEISGNVATVTVSQPASQLRRGGSLWAKVGPYVVLFSEETRRLLEKAEQVCLVTRSLACPVSLEPSVSTADGG